MTHNNPYKAKLVIPEMPRTQEAQNELVTWLEKIIKEIKTDDPHAYASPVTFRLLTALIPNEKKV